MVAFPSLFIGVWVALNFFWNDGADFDDGEVFREEFSFGSSCSLCFFDSSSARSDVASESDRGSGFPSAESWPKSSCWDGSRRSLLEPKS